MCLMTLLPERVKNDLETYFDDHFYSRLQLFRDEVKKLLACNSFFFYSNCQFQGNKTKEAKANKKIILLSVLCFLPYPQKTSRSRRKGCYCFTWKLLRWRDANNVSAYRGNNSNLWFLLLQNSLFFVLTNFLMNFYFVETIERILMQLFCASHKNVFSY